MPEGPSLKTRWDAHVDRCFKDLDQQLFYAKNSLTWAIHFRDEGLLRVVFEKPPRTPLERHQAHVREVEWSRFRLLFVEKAIADTRAFVATADVSSEELLAVAVERLFAWKNK